jgi:hypothetical protein
LATIEPGEDLLSILRSGQASRELRLFAARDLLPLDPDDRIRALLVVASDADPEASEAAHQTLRATPPDTLTRFLTEADPDTAEIAAVARVTDDPFVLERIIRHRTVSDETLLELARTVTGAPQEALIINQVRLLRQPALIDALLENSELTGDGRRRLNELREEFFEKSVRRQEAEQARIEKERQALEEAEAADAAAAAEPGGETGEPAADLGQASPDLATAFRKIARMTAAEKIDLAHRGSKDERRILIADVNRLVWQAVLKSRALSFAEVETFCSMRHLDAEIFRTISENRQWMRRPVVVLALVRNPSVSLTITLPLVKHLNLRDLRTVTKDRNLPEGLRVAARKFLIDRKV